MKKEKKEKEKIPIYFDLMNRSITVAQQLAVSDLLHPIHSIDSIQFNWHLIFETLATFNLTNSLFMIALTIQN